MNIKEEVTTKKATSDVEEKHHQADQ